MSKSVLVILFVTSLVLLALMSFGSGYASAESGDQRTKGLTVSPLRTELTIDPGTSQDATLTVKNSNERPISVHLSVEEFSVIDQQYDYVFNQETKLTKWVTFTPNTLDLDPGQTKTANFRIGVPLGSEPGGRYLSMFATTDAGSPISGAVSRQRVASLIYLTVNGDVSRSGSLVSLSAPWFITSQSDWTANIQNTGSTHYHSRYNVAIQPLIGNEIISSSLSSALILPGTIRLVKDALPLPALPGIYKAVYTIGLGDSPAVIETRYIIYMPPVAIIVSIFGIILLVSLISEYKSRKNKKTKTNQSVEQRYKLPK